MLFGAAFLAFLVPAFVTAGSFQCLTDKEAKQFVDDFTIIASARKGYKKLAEKVMDPGFVSITDSVNFVDGIPVSSVKQVRKKAKLLTYTQLNTTMTHSRKQLFKQEAKLPGFVEVKDLFIGHTCETVTWYFEFETTPLPTRGIAILFVNAERKIYKAFREVNSGAVLYNLGQPECESNFTVSVGDGGPEPIVASCACPVS